MDDRVLYIDSQRVDLPDSVAFNLVWQIAEPGQLKVYGSGSSTIKLPFTPANDSVFGNCKHLTVVGGREFETFEGCRYYERGMLMIDGGKAYITAISDGYEICLTWGNGDLVQELKDTPLYEKSIGAFRWDASHLYPLAETSENPEDYPAFYHNPNNGLLTMRLAMTRPIVRYTDVLAVAGITQDTIPENIYGFVKDTFLQINGTQATGYYTDAVSVRTPGPDDDGYVIDNVQMFVDGDDGASPRDDLFGVNGIRIGQISIANEGTFRIEVAGAYHYETGYTINKTGKTEYFGSFCVFLVDKDYGDTLSVCRYTMIENMFLDDGMTGYETTYRCTVKAGGVGHDVRESVRPVALGYASGWDTPLTLVDVSDPGQELVRLQKMTYYLYICPRHTKNRVFDKNTLPGNPPAGDVYQRTFSGDVTVDSTATFRETTVKDSATRIDGPEDPILKTDPPDIITMLGYSTAAEIAEDFLTMFPLMCQPDTTAGKPRLIYFGFDEVIANMGNAYDWSGAFVSLSKVEMGNPNVGLRNRVRFASYGDYAGFRADSTFDSFSLGEAEKDYGTMKRIANYDYLRSMTVNDNGYDLTVPAGEYPLVKVTEKDGVYSAGGLNSVPSVFFYFHELDWVKARLDDGSGSVAVGYSEESGMNTMEYIIHGKRRVLGYWYRFLNVIRRQKTVTVTLNIHPAELNGFDFRRPVYLKQLSVYVFAQKITYKGGMAAELQGVVLPKAHSGIPLPVEDGMLVDSADSHVVDSADTYIVEQ